MRADAVVARLTRNKVAEKFAYHVAAITRFLVNESSVEPTFVRAFVVAAHPDDDAIGCGGLLWHIARAGGDVCVCYLTDGSQSHPGSKRYPPASVAALRAMEARASLRILGIGRAPLFFGIRDGSLGKLKQAVRLQTVDRLARAIEAFEPDVVLAPWIRDPHPDHVAASRMTADALAKLSKPPALYGYEVWLSIRGSRAEHPQPGETTTRELILDPQTIERKRRGILAHRTQTTPMIDDDPDGFYISEPLLQLWLGTTERLHAMSILPPGSAGA